MREFCVEYLDSENRTYEITVFAYNEDDAIDEAVRETEQDYHGIKTILSVS